MSVTMNDYCFSNIGRTTCIILCMIVYSVPTLLVKWYILTHLGCICMWMFIRHDGFGKSLCGLCVCVWILWFSYYVVKSLSGLEAWYFVTPLESEVFWWLLSCASGCWGVALWWNGYVFTEDFMHIHVTFLNVIIINYNMEDANVTYVFLTDPFDIADAMIVGLGKKVGFNDCR